MASECPVCLALPEGEVHQCMEGHCYCAECWNRLDPRSCPQCRQPLPQANRNRAAERAIAALAWSCEHCGEATTRGAKAAHLLACAKRPTAGSAPADGGGWLAAGDWLAAGGRLVRRLLRRRSSALCRRMMAPLEAECQELRAQNRVLQSHNMQLEGPRRRRKELEAQNERLRQDVAALQAVSGRVRPDAPEADEEEGPPPARRPRTTITIN